MISDRFEDFAQSLRIFIEQKYRYRELFLIDADEAVGNVELACKSMLDTFASLYDASRAEDQVNFISMPTRFAVLSSPIETPSITTRRMVSVALTNTLGRMNDRITYVLIFLRAKARKAAAS
ncbi:hypothetical protein AL073_18205 [Loktanella sp. 1ANDIMAR09]|nr:hypothetical protein AL073_18205 [Loktanella sp. 1ANDIMAR09]